MDRGRVFLYCALGAYFLALIFFWVATSGLSGGWYTSETRQENKTNHYDYGTLSYTLKVTSTSGPTMTVECKYTKNNGTLCVNYETMDSAGEFVLVDTIFAWLCLAPAIVFLAIFMFSKDTPRLGLAKVSWGLGAVSFFWAIWGWLVYAIKFSGSSASPSWAWGLDFLAFILCAVGLAFSILGVKFGTTSYEVMGGAAEMKGVNQPHDEHEDEHDYGHAV